MAVSPEYYGEFLKRMGHSVRFVGGMWWFDTSRGVYNSFPFDRNIDAETVCVRSVLGRDGIVARFGCPEHQGVPSHRFICDDADYDFPQLRSRTRTQVRRGLEECQVEQVDFDVLRRHAVELNADTLIRQKRRVPKNLNTYWQKYFDAAEVTTGAEAWGAFADGQLAAYLISFVVESTAHILIVRSSSQHLKKLPNNALLFQYLYQRIRDENIHRISYGYESIQAGLGTLDQFKVGMGFRTEVCGQRVELAGWIRPLLNRYTLPSLSKLLKSIGEGETTGKLQGILTWYQQQPELSASVQQPRSAA